MPKHKMITKSCQKCSAQVPVACKTCPCGSPFVTGQRKAMLLAAESRDAGSVQRRRTERVKREKPNYYDSLEYEKQHKKKRKRKRAITDESTESQPVDNVPRLKKRNRKKVLKVEREPEEEDIIATLSPEKDYKCSLILSEINRKMCLTSWRV